MSDCSCSTAAPMPFGMPPAPGQRQCRRRRCRAPSAPACAMPTRRAGCEGWLRRRDRAAVAGPRLRQELPLRTPNCRRRSDSPRIVSAGDRVSARAGGARERGRGYGWRLDSMGAGSNGTLRFGSGVSPAGWARAARWRLPRAESAQAPPSSHLRECQRCPAPASDICLRRGFRYKEKHCHR